jgi:hypothetical protein
MTMPDRSAEPDQAEARRALETARPDQIERLLRDILKTASNNDSKPTGRA